MKRSASEPKGAQPFFGNSIFDASFDIVSKSLYLTTGRETTPSSGKRCLEEVLAPPPLFGDFEGLLRAESRAKNRSSNSSRSSNRSRSSSQRKQSTAHSIDCGVPNWLLYRARAPEDLSALDCASRKPLLLLVRMKRTRTLLNDAHGSYQSPTVEEGTLRYRLRGIRKSALRH